MSKASARDRLEQALARIADPAGEGKRACLTIYVDAARATADVADARATAGKQLGPLDGAIVSIKDLYDVAGEVTRAGSRVLAGEGLVATADAPTTVTSVQTKPKAESRAASAGLASAPAVSAVRTKSAVNSTADRKDEPVGELEEREVFEI